jgi:hypothetical protein
MPITLRPTGGQYTVDKDRQDYSVYSGEWPIGRINEGRGNPPELRWFWTIFGIYFKPPRVDITGYAPTLEAAKADFEANWRKWQMWEVLEP